jgi:hypothetical protein
MQPPHLGVCWVTLRLQMELLGSTLKDKKSTALAVTDFQYVDVSKEKFASENDLHTGTIFC